MHARCTNKNDSAALPPPLKLPTPGIISVGSGMLVLLNTWQKCELSTFCNLGKLKHGNGMSV